MAIECNRVNKTTNNIIDQIQLFAHWAIFRNFSYVCWYFFKINIFENFLQEYHQIVKQLGFRVFQVWSWGAKLSADCTGKERVLMTVSQRIGTRICMSTHKMPSRSCSRWHFQILILFEKKNESWYSMWIICQQMIHMEYQASFSPEIQKDICKTCLLQCDCSLMIDTICVKYLILIFLQNASIQLLEHHQIPYFSDTYIFAKKCKIISQWYLCSLPSAHVLFNLLPSSYQKHTFCAPIIFILLYKDSMSIHFFLLKCKDSVLSPHLLTQESRFCTLFIFLHMCICSGL